ncbi:uncharacterized protein [Hoplias malabaricus]|uniref:uncharacterized protein n=1 Tax=Hoplias malabaricus TaxID=27720 RepID=UPI003461DC25
MLGDLGRHGEGLAYQQFSKKFSRISMKTTQEHKIHKGMWKQRKRNQRGVYVTPMKKPFLNKVKKISEPTKSSRTNLKAEVPVDDKRDEDLIYKQPSTVQSHPLKLITSTPSTSYEPLTSKGKGMKTRSRRENLGPVWGNHSPQEIIPAARLSRPVIIHHDQLISILDPHIWLSSDEIDSACFYMAQKYDDTDGFQSCLLFSALHRGSIVGTPVKPFVQVLNINDNHWITASNIFCQPNEVCIYDSLNSGINNNTKQMLSWMIRPSAPDFIIRKPTVQIQQSGSNCGLFALAFAKVLCDRVRPEECLIEEKN